MSDIYHVAAPGICLDDCVSRGHDYGPKHQNNEITCLHKRELARRAGKRFLRAHQSVTLRQQLSGVVQ